MLLILGRPIDGLFITVHDLSQPGLAVFSNGWFFPWKKPFFSTLEEIVFSSFFHLFLDKTGKNYFFNGFDDKKQLNTRTTKGVNLTESRGLPKRQQCKASLALKRRDFGLKMKEEVRCFLTVLVSGLYDV